MAIYLKWYKCLCYEPLVAQISICATSGHKLRSFLFTVVYIHTVTSRYIEAGYNEVPAYIEMGLSPRVLNAFIFIPL